MDSINTVLDKATEKSQLRFLDRCHERLIDTDSPVFCPFCGSVKKEFQNPPGHYFYRNGQRVQCAEAERIQVLSCRCEREATTLRDWYKLQLEIYGADYDAWRLTGKSKHEQHFRTMDRVRGEIDRINAIMRTRGQ